MDHDPEKQEAGSGHHRSNQSESSRSSTHREQQAPSPTDHDHTTSPTTVKEKQSPATDHNPLRTIFKPISIPGRRRPGYKRRQTGTNNNITNINDNSHYDSNDHIHQDESFDEDRDLDELERAVSREIQGTAGIDLASTLSPFPSRSRSRSRSATRTTSASAPGPDLPPPPDGGRAAWTQVCMGWLVIFSTWGYINSFGSFQAYYITSLAPLSPSDISWIGSVQTWLTFLVGAFSGRLLDAGYYIPTVMVGATVQLAGIFLMSVSTSFWQLMLTQGVLTGVGGGTVFTPSLALVATYFSERRGMALGLATTGNSAGGIVYPIVVRQLLPQIGFGWATRTLGFINLAFYVLVLTFMRPRLPPRRSGPIIDWSAFRDPVYTAFCAGQFFFTWMIYYSFSYVGSYGRQVLGMSYQDAALLITIINGVGAPFRILSPMVAYHIGPLNTIALTSLLVTAVVFSWLGVHSVTGIYIFTTFFGITSGCFQCLMPTGLASITKRLDIVGTRLGMCFSMLSFAGLTGPPLGGALQLKGQGDGGYLPSQVWAAVSSLICFGLFVTARVFRVGWKPSAKC